MNNVHQSVKIENKRKVRQKVKKELRVEKGTKSQRYIRRNERKQWKVHLKTEIIKISHHFKA